MIFHFGEGTYLCVFSQWLPFSSLCALNVNKTEDGSELAQFSLWEVNSLLPGSGWFPLIHIWAYSSSSRVLLPAFNLGTWETEEDGLVPCLKKWNVMKRNKMKPNKKVNKTKHKNQPIKRTKNPRTLFSLAFQVPFFPASSLFFLNCFYFYTLMNLQNNCKWSAKDVWGTRQTVDRTGCPINLEHFIVSYTQRTRVFTFCFTSLM